MDRDTIYNWFDGLEIESDFFLVDLSISKNKISLIIDRDKGISIGDCTKINRLLNSWLEEKVGENHDYQSEVSSPGVGNPLLLKRQFKNNVGRKMNLIAKDNSTYKGLLKEVNGDRLIFEAVHKAKSKKDEDYILEFNNIKEAKVLI